MNRSRFIFGSRFGSALLAAAAGAILAVASPAFAGDLYVDDDSGDDTAPCTYRAAPCQTIEAALDRAVAAPGSGDTVWVDGGEYEESLTLGDDNSLRELEFNGNDSDNEATIRGQSGWYAVRVLTGDPAGRIEGFTLHSEGAFALELSDAATVTGNVFNSISDGTPGIAVIRGASRISNNVLDATPGGVTVGVVISGGGPDIRDNLLRDLTDAIRLESGSGATASITGNEITGLNRDIGFAHGIDLGPTTHAVISGNSIHSPVTSSGTIGINAEDDGFSVLGTNLEMSRNRISGQDIGVRLADTAFSTMFSDLIAGNGVGVAAGSSGINTGDVRATNVTVAGNGTDLSLAGNALELDSSIVGDPVTVAGTASCLIIHSAGPTAIPGGNGCLDFQTRADPQFVAPGSGDYHLTADSPLIDAGDREPVYDWDIDGDLRTLDSDLDGTAIRDIGADEFVPDTTPPDTAPPDTAPPDTAPSGSPPDDVSTRDATAPRTRITSRPAKRTGRRSARFRFRSSERGSTFACRLDRARWRRCRSPRRYRHLNPGRHTFAVRAIDGAGNADRTPARRSWWVRR